MNWIKIRNWKKFQHYKDRNPPWIKLHRDLLRDYDFGRLQDASKLLQILLWVLASQLDNKIPDDPDYIKKHIPFDGDIDLNPLIDNGFIERYQDASKTLAERKQSAMPETETETEEEAEIETEEEAEKESAKELDRELEKENSNPLSSHFIEDPRFAQFWEAYPRKVGKGGARKSFAKAILKIPIETMLAAIANARQTDQWSKEGGKFIPHPATWLNQERWSDEVEVPAQKKRGGFMDGYEHLLKTPAERAAEKEAKNE